MRSCASFGPRTWSPIFSGISSSPAAASGAHHLYLRKIRVNQESGQEQGSAQLRSTGDCAGTEAGLLTRSSKHFSFANSRRIFASLSPAGVSIAPSGQLQYNNTLECDKCGHRSGSNRQDSISYLVIQDDFVDEQAACSNSRNLRRIPAYRTLINGAALQPGMKRQGRPRHKHAGGEVVPCTATGATHRSLRE